MVKRCRQCATAKPEVEFYRSKRSSDGRDSYCKDCRDGRTHARVAAKRASRPPVTEKRCPKCGEVKALTEFYRRPDRAGGRQSACKTCKNAAHTEYIARPEVAAKLKEQARNRRMGNWKRPPRREPLSEGFEVCTMCNLDKRLDEFHRHKLGRNGRDSTCKECRAVISRERRKDPAYREREHRWKVEREHGLRRGQYDDMLDAQNGVCGICGNGSSKRFHVDHDHHTGEIRGLLCFNCNAGLGQLGDDPARLVAAYEYLTKERI